MSEHFYLSATNPNVGIGGSGCVCNPSGDADCEGPFAIFPAAEAVENLSPHIVVGMGCIRAASREASKGKKALLEASS